MEVTLESKSSTQRQFAASNKASIFQNKDQDSRDDEREATTVAPIPLPRRENEEDHNAPLLDAMKRTRDDPKKLEEYIRTRPNELDPHDEAFERVPIEQFGRAMLEGMGYQEDKSVIAPCLLDGRPNLLGLGARPKQEESRGQSHKSKRQFITIGALGQISGTHKFAVVIQSDGVPGLDMIRVKTFGDSSREGELIDLEIPRGKFLMIKDQETLDEKHPAKRVLNAYQKFQQEEAKRAEHAYQKRQKLVSNVSKTWLRPGLRVLYVDDRDQELYKRKAVVQEVNEEKGKCNIRMETDDRMTLKDIKAKYLQTVVPDEPGITLMVVDGPHVGKTVSLIQRNKRKGIVEARFKDGNEGTFDLDEVCAFLEHHVG